MRLNLRIPLAGHSPAAAVLVLVLTLLVFAMAGPALAKVKVVATLEDLGWIAQQVGGEDVEVEVLCPGHRDPHTLPAKPSLTRKMKKADLLVYNGLELEIGWLPLLLNAARNPRIRPGQQGELDCSLALEPDDILEVPTGEVDRSQGDIHPLGNPHYTQDPRKGIAIGHLVAERLAQIDPPSSERYLRRADLLEETLSGRIKDWESRICGLAEIKLIVYHQQWEYLVDWLGLEIIGIIENRPGISPSPRHVENLVELGRSQDKVLVMAATWDHIDGARRVAEKIGTDFLVLPASSQAVEAAPTYLDLFEFICSALETHVPPARGAGP
jgi:zinc/manganese transport system substrate-binding protein